jgi:hypothetical protein
MLTVPSRPSEISRRVSHAGEVDELLSRSLAPVLRDLRESGGPVPEVRDVDWAGDPDQPSTMLYGADGSGAGVSVRRALPEPQRVADAADQVQQWAIEDRWGRAPTNWPPCPRHPDSHPLTATVRDGKAVWTCPGDGTVTALLGGLAPREVR